MKLCVAVLLCLLFASMDARSIKRSAEIRSICSKTTPCGWEIYKPYIRTVEYFMKSPCDCPSGSRCVRSSDDISISAFVYRCSPVEGTPASPHDS
ncbi:uncharacterized protein TNIN_453311 [Trichonephila inaurata madagascariensis]|uniref:Uncharacterized protein n=1 Tax=Trichonephila inaurata madagascariensis TaxID=2747483 RepID=A0A8X6YMQ8_9ARAC|nr:uncharacterized protein TNIN_453311 [Trichonephila inaurata madagascariensis]